MAGQPGGALVVSSKPCSLQPWLRENNRLLVLRVTECKPLEWESLGDLSWYLLKSQQKCHFREETDFVLLLFLSEIMAEINKSKEIRLISYHRTIEYPELEGTHRDHWSAAPGPALHVPESVPNPPWALDVECTKNQRGRGSQWTQTQTLL